MDKYRFVSASRTVDNTAHPIYLSNEESITHEPNLPAGFSLILSVYCGIDINVDTNEFVSLSGLNPSYTWQNVNDLKPPKGVKKAVKIVSGTKLGMGFGDAISPLWPTYYSHNTGWFCMGALEYPIEAETIEFAPESIAILAQGALLAVWFKPVLR